MRQDLLQLIDNNDFISFDIFDTLLFRKIYRPTDIFRILSNIACIICQLFSILLYAVYKLCLYYASVVLVAKIYKKVESAKKRTKKLVVKESSLFVLCLAHCLIKTGIFMTR